MVVAQPPGLALAGEAQDAAQRRRARRRVDAGAAVDGVDAVAEGVQRHPVADRVHAQVLARRAVGRGGVGQRAHMVAAEQVGMLHRHARAPAAGGGRAGVVERGDQPQRVVVGHRYPGIDRAGHRAFGQRHRNLLGRVVVGQLHRFGDRPQLRRLAGLQADQAGADVVFGEVLLAGDDDRRHHRLDDADLDRAAVQFLLGHRHLHRRVARVAVGALDRLDGQLHVAEGPLRAGERGHGAVDRGLGDERVAFDPVAGDVEACGVGGRRGHRHGERPAESIGCRQARHRGETAWAHRWVLSPAQCVRHGSSTAAGRKGAVIARHCTRTKPVPNEYKRFQNELGGYTLGCGLHTSRVNRRKGMRGRAARVARCSLLVRGVLSGWGLTTGCHANCSAACIAPSPPGRGRG